MIYAIYDENYKVLAHSESLDELKQTIDLFQPKNKGKEIVEIEGIEVSYDNKTYVKGHLPVVPEDIAKVNVKRYRDMLLSNSDCWGVSDRPQTEEVLKRKEWRQYLRDYTNEENWWLKNPMTYEEWSSK